MTIVPRHAELVPRRTPPPLPPHRPPIHRTWLRELFTPAPLHSYLTAGERCVVATRRHWLVPLWRLARGGGMMTAVGIFTFLLPGFLLVQLALLLAALAHTAWIGWCILDWRVEQVVVTDSRLLHVHGIVTITVDAVQLSQITDAELRCTVLGRLLGYGSIRVETAGQRPVERLDYVPSPTAFWRATLIAEHQSPPAGVRRAA